MSIASNFVGIKGWFATVVSIVPMKKNGVISYIAGEMQLLPHEKGSREFQMGGKDLCLDVFFHCYTVDVAQKFFREISEGDNLIITGDLSERDWRGDDCKLKTNCWLDEFVIDENDHTVSPTAANFLTNNHFEYNSTANLRYSVDCVGCGEPTLKMPGDSRRFCMECDS